MGRFQTAESTTSSDYLELNISVLFPNTARPSTFDNFITYLPGFVQSFGNLTGYVYFTNLGIEGAWRDILSTVRRIMSIRIRWADRRLSIRQWQRPGYP